jgi:Clp amino terminal domain, pathogenicity island component
MADEPPENLDSPMFERFTERARQVVVLAGEEARALKHNYIGTEHILLGLLCEEEGLAARVLESLDITVERVRAQVVRIVGSGEEVTSGQIPFTPRVKKVFELALREALSLGHNYIGTEHVLLGVVRENEGVAARILLDLDADPEKVRNEVIRMLSGGVRRRAAASAGSGSEPAIDPGWLDGLPELLKPLGEEIRAELGRAPDVGDLLLAVACVPHTPAAEALSELSVDVDELWGRIERARLRAQTTRQALAKRMAEAAQAKEQAIEEGRFTDASELRDQERELREEARSHQRARLDAVDELRQRLGIPRQPDGDR